jgi:hypothetical protein
VATKYPLNDSHRRKNSIVEQNIDDADCNTGLVFPVLDDAGNNLATRDLVL